MRPALRPNDGDAQYRVALLVPARAAGAVVPPREGLDGVKVAPAADAARGERVGSWQWQRRGDGGESKVGVGGDDARVQEDVKGLRGEGDVGGVNGLKGEEEAGRAVKLLDGERHLGGWRGRTTAAPVRGSVVKKKRRNVYSKAEIRAGSYLKAGEED
ncbi:hypothetical protein BBAD15_g2389 [Beauveria bassiana D1-5]|uniref:Uncharacterized protein n=1 Tax=Beauveria bassiana D1-5 TaxID=1245745 RepID=A0A0A2WFE4_BEABA|nr:hypothetical protein BBAD15_g2389 [Beauveria bassiana D1-5]